MFSNDEKLAARKLAQDNVPIQPCEVCGATENIHRHHDDYSKPLEVRFVCPKHHKQIHPNTYYNKPHKISLAPPEMLARCYTRNTKQKTEPARRLRLKTIANRRAAKISQEDLEFIHSL